MMGYDPPIMKGGKRSSPEGKPSSARARPTRARLASAATAPGSAAEAELIDAGEVEGEEDEAQEPELAELTGGADGGGDEPDQADDVIDVVAEDDEPTGGLEPEQPTARIQPGLVRHDPLTAYMSEIRRVPLLSREEELELAKRYFETGDLAIARRLITANLRLVVKIAHEYRRAHRNLLDLIQEGNVGLIQAMKKYDPYRGVKLSSYAAWWIRAYILKFILNNWRMVKIGTTQAQRKLFFNLRKEKEKLEQLGFAPEHRLLAERLDVSEAEVAEMEQRLEGADMSLDAPLQREDAAGATRLDVLPSLHGTRPDVVVESDEFRALLRSKLEAFADELEGREAQLFRERWLTDAPLTLQELGDRFGISRERARQIERRMLDRLRRHLEAELGTAVDIGALGSEE
jgi:RNA polymerase sigma-32 factor